MLFDLYDCPKEQEYDYWVKRVHTVATTLNYDYFKLWEIPELEFLMLEGYAKDSIAASEKKMSELKNQQ